MQECVAGMASRNETQTSPLHLDDVPISSSPAGEAPVAVSSQRDQLQHGVDLDSSR